MDRKTSIEQPGRRSNADQAVAKRMRQVIGQFLFIAVVLLITSGRLTWVWLWAYVFVGICILAVNTRVIPRDLIAERGQPGENVKPWDMRLTRLSILPLLGMLIITGLDERFGWTPDLPVALHLGGLALMIVGQALFTWAMASNKFFSTAVRIQMDRDHAVASGGPYRFVRHPGYVGYILFTVATPLIFGSLWGLIPAAIMGVLMVIRTRLEDKTLLEELAGYQEYAQLVRYRLLPGVW